MGQKQHSVSSVQTIERAAAILRCFNEDHPELGVTDISQRTKLHKSTVSRMLLALKKEAFVTQNPQTGKWHLGFGLLNLAGVILEQMDLRSLAKAHLLDLAEITQETINISILDGNECVNVECITSPKPIQYAGRLGRRVPLHCTSTGKVLLAFLSAEQRFAMMPGKLHPYTKDTPVDRSSLETTLNQIRTAGYAIAHEEFQEGLSAIAAPIRDHNGYVIATVSVSGPTFRMGPGRIEQFVEPLLNTAARISADLGFVSSGKEVLRKDL